MKKMVYFTLMVLLFMVLIGTGSAEAKVNQSNKIVASDVIVTLDYTTIEQTIKVVDDMLLAKKKKNDDDDEGDDDDDDNDKKKKKKKEEKSECGKYSEAACDFLESVCCQSSPYYDKKQCKDSWKKKNCGECYDGCGGWK